MEALLIYQKQKLLTLSVAITASVVTAICNFTNPAEARNGWVRAGCSKSTGNCLYVKVLSTSDYPIVKFKSNHTNGLMHTEEAHCFKWAMRYVNDDGSRDPWKEQMPGTVGESMLEAVCE